jgi:hypothetical protein
MLKDDALNAGKGLRNNGEFELISQGAENAAVRAAVRPSPQDLVVAVRRGIRVVKFGKEREVKAIVAQDEIRADRDVFDGEAGVPAGSGLGLAQDEKEVELACRLPIEEKHHRIRLP